MSLPYTLTFADGADFVTGPTALTLGDAFSVEAVARVDTFGVCNRSIVHKYATGDGALALYVTPDARLYFVVYDDHGGASSAWSAAGAVAGAWQHMAGVFDRANLRIRVYIDGADATQGYVITGYAVNTSAAPVKLGGTLDGLAAGFAGAIAWARISNTARYTGAFVPAYGQAPTADDATVELWALSEGGGATVNGDAITGATWGLWGAQAAAWPATVYLGLLTANPATGSNEVTGSGYARLAIANNATNFTTTGGVTTLATAQTFGAAGEDWGALKAWGLWDAASGGTLLQWGPAARLAFVHTGATVRLAAGALEIGSL